jgi:ribonuclease HIII
LDVRKKPNHRQLILKSFQLPDYTMNQLRYDLRKMKAHGLIHRNGRQYSYLLTEKGVKVGTMFVLFHKRLCGPLANSLFVHRPNRHFITNSKLEKAYHKADDYIDKINELLAA